jgi:hypothetical protein
MTVPRQSVAVDWQRYVLPMQSLPHCLFRAPFAFPLTLRQKPNSARNKRGLDRLATSLGDDTVRVNVSTEGSLSSLLEFAGDQLDDIAPPSGPPLGSWLRLSRRHAYLLRTLAKMASPLFAVRGHRRMLCASRAQCAASSAFGRFALRVPVLGVGPPPRPMLTMPSTVYGPHAQLEWFVRISLPMDALGIDKYTCVDPHLTVADLFLASASHARS